MDAKALAKSKRAHSQHHKKKSHPGQKPKTPSVVPNNAGTTEKTQGKQVGDRSHQSRHVSALPSNWDRYEDEFDVDVGEGTSQVSDVVVPKSKGADFRHLIAEAEAESHLHSSSHADSFASLDDVIPGDFIQGVCSMLSVRGEGILSWAGDDNFVVEDKSTSAQEASFLSLNLNDLAEQLEKVDLPQRLFVEADVLPSELVTERLTASSNQESCSMQSIQETEDVAFHNSSEMCVETMRTAYESEATANLSKDSAFNDFSNEVNIMDTEIKSRPNLHISASFSTQGFDLTDRVKNGSNSSQFGNFRQSQELKPIAQSEEHMIADSKKEPSKFEAASAEAELDMLLNSFGETKFPDSPGTKFNNNGADSQQANTTALSKLSERGPDVSKPTSMPASFDDLLDDLLEETSNLSNQNSLSQPQNVPSASHPVTKSKVLDDFDSWLDTI